MTEESAKTIDPADLRRLATGVALLVAAAVSVTLALLAWSAPSLTDFVAKNLLPLSRRKVALALTLGVGGVVALGLVAFGLRTKPSPAQRILRWGKIACPLIVTAFLPPLFLRGPWGAFEIQYLVLLGLFGLLLEQLLSISLAELAPSPLALPERFARIVKWLPCVLVAAGVLYYTILISHYTLVSHWRMATATTDLGEYDNQFFNSLHGHPFRLPASEGNLNDWSALKFHADFVIYALLPFYAIKPGPETLLVMQTVLVAGTAIPIYLFGAKRLPRWIAALVALSFLLLPVIQRPNFYDFHAVPIGMFFVAWAVWAIDRILHCDAPKRRDYVFFWAAFALALASREDIAFGMVAVSGFLLFYGKRPRLVLAMLGISIAYFVLIKFVIMPRIGVVWYHNIYDDLKAQGLQRYGAVVATILTNPVFVLKSMISEPKLLYVLHMSVPLLCLWLRRPYLLVAAIPSVFFTLMVTNRPPMFQTSFQYAFGWFPYIVIASILMLKHLGEEIGKHRQTGAAVALALVAAGAGYQYGVLLGGTKIIGGFGERRLDPLSRDELTRYRDVKALAGQIPREASVAATNHVGPHVSTRLVLYNLGYTLGEKPDFILFQRPLGKPEGEHVRPVVMSGEYGLVDQRGAFSLLKRGHDTSRNEQVLQQIGRR